MRGFHNENRFVVDELIEGTAPALAKMGANYLRELIKRCYELLCLGFQSKFALWWRRGRTLVRPRQATTSLLRSSTKLCGPTRTPWSWLAGIIGGKKHTCSRSGPSSTRTSRISSWKSTSSKSCGPSRSGCVTRSCWCSSCRTSLGIWRPCRTFPPLRTSWPVVATALHRWDVAFVGIDAW